MKTDSTTEAVCQLHRAGCHEERSAVTQQATEGLSTRRSLLRKVLSSAALLGLETAAKKQPVQAQGFWDGITVIPGNARLNASWVHGHSMLVQGPAHSDSLGFAGRLHAPANSTTWIHFPIPTPTLLNSTRELRISSVMLIFRLPAGCAVSAVHVWEGDKLLARHDTLSLYGDQWFTRFGVPGIPLVKTGISISVLVRNESLFVQLSEFSSAGADFYDW